MGEHTHLPRLPTRTPLLTGPSGASGDRSSAPRTPRLREDSWEIVLVYYGVDDDNEEEEDVEF